MYSPNPSATECRSLIKHTRVLMTKIFMLDFRTGASLDDAIALFID